MLVNQTDGCAGSIKYCYNSGNVTITANGNWCRASGIVESNCIVESCYNTGNISVLNPEDTETVYHGASVAGLVGVVGNINWSRYIELL